VLIKDNHVAVAGGVSQAVARARGQAPHGLKIEVEVDSLAQLEEALAANADIILLDNFSPADIEWAVARVKRQSPRPLLEVSGGVTLERIAELAGVGVDIVSAGALTHSAPAVDLALDLEMGGPEP
jgi:nicotinate-nucleotide pyrophosphorylase (carboxylating)